MPVKLLNAYLSLVLKLKGACKIIDRFFVFIAFWPNILIRRLSRIRPIKVAIIKLYDFGQIYNKRNLKSFNKIRT